MDGFNPFESQSGGYTPPTPPMEKMKKYGKKIFLAVKVIAVILLLAIIGFNSVYILDSGNEAVITCFGAYSRTETDTGLKFKIPFVENIDVVNVQSIRRMEFGYNSATNTDVPEESIMLTGDECLVNADWAIQYRIMNGYDYLYHVQDPDGTFRIIAESAYRRVVASHKLDDILTNQKDVMQREVMEDLQEICNKYQLGILITGVQLQDAAPPDEVKQSFLEVTSAKEDKEAKINQAAQYENEKLPLARGDAEKIINDAEAYAEARINNARGEVARYSAIAAEYKNQPQITRTRMYLEMITDVLPRLRDVYIVSPKGETVQFLQLNGDAKDVPDSVKNQAVNPAESGSTSNTTSNKTTTGQTQDVVQP